MRRNYWLMLFLMTLTVLFATTVTPLAAANEPDGTIAMTIGCQPGNNWVVIYNRTNHIIQLAGWTLGSIYQPGPNEPFILPSIGILPGGQTPFFNGAAKTQVLTGKDIFQNHPTEGARLVTFYGTLEVLCSAGTGSLPVPILPGVPKTGGGYAANTSWSGWSVVLVLVTGALLLAPRQRRRQ